MPISLRDMTCLFTVVTLPVVNALLLIVNDLTTMLAIDMALLATLTLLHPGRERPGRSAGEDRKPGSAGRYSIRLKYDNLKLLDPQQRPVLLEDLRERTGLEPHHLGG